MLAERGERGIDGRVIVVEGGRIAAVTAPDGVAARTDLVVDPLGHIRALRRVRLVLAGGRVISR